jgi:hypothetical protein
LKFPQRTPHASKNSQVEKCVLRENTAPFQTIPSSSHG